ncbi:MAG: hypothetical protein J7M25_12295 [Deltaproteobacteria bacterium]|nr:hypothetical protein [Deltaproteobacteria bacterium]
MKLVAAALLLWIWQAACVVPTDRSDNVAPTHDFYVVGADVQQGATSVPKNRDLTVIFSDRPDLATLSQATVRIKAGGHTIRTDYHQDLVRCSVTLHPSEEMAPGLTHILSARPPLTSVHGVVLDQEWSVGFTTGDATSPHPNGPVVSDDTIGHRVFDTRCGCCHDPVVGTARHILALDATTAVTQYSNQRPNLLLVQPGSQRDSYLVHKVLGLSDIIGEPMPPPGQECAGTTAMARSCASIDPDLLLLADWIDGHP